MNIIHSITAVYLCTIMHYNTAKDLPAAWDKNFNITFSSKAGMMNVSSSINFTCDSVVYTHHEKGRTQTHQAELSATDKFAILEKMRSLQIDKIHTITTEGIPLDKSSISICFTGDATNCLQDGAVETIAAPDMGNFREACRYLQAFAAQKTGKK